MTEQPVDPLRHRIMAAVRDKDSSAELLVRSYLHRHGFRFRLHADDLSGRPDIVLPRWRAAIFVHGCFWHRHARCSRSTTPTTRRAFWLAKFQRNVERDRAAVEKLLATEWRVAVVWECGLTRHCRESTLSNIDSWLKSGGAFLEVEPRNN
jgi:DNA mismatch endonuclease (patch repair protein)